MIGLSGFCNMPSYFSFITAEIRLFKAHYENLQKLVYKVLKNVFSKNAKATLLQKS